MTLPVRRSVGHAHRWDPRRDFDDLHQLEVTPVVDR
jgi:hypothetical protein